jgi:hypothetical protein
VIATVPDRPTHQLLIGERAVDLGGVDERDAQVERPMDGADGLGIVAARPGVSAGHPHGTQTDATDIQGPQIYVLHRCSPFPVLLGHVVGLLQRLGQPGGGHARNDELSHRTI